MQLGVWGERSPIAGSEAEPQPKSNLVHFSLKMQNFSNPDQGKHFQIWRLDKSGVGKNVRFSADKSPYLRNAEK